MMPRVFLISPFAESTIYTPASWLCRGNVKFAQRCAADCFARCEAPFIPHLLYTQPGILDDSQPHEREKGMTAGRRFLAVCDKAVCYLDRGCSSGMLGDLKAALTFATPIEFRRLDGKMVSLIHLHRDEIPHDKCSLCEVGGYTKPPTLRHR